MKTDLPRPQLHGISATFLMPESKCRRLPENGGRIEPNSFQHGSLSENASWNTN